MSLSPITEEMLAGKGNLGRPDTPGVTAAEMQRILDELPREVIVPAFNGLVAALADAAGAADLGARAPDGGASTVQAQLDSRALAADCPTTAQMTQAITAAVDGAVIAAGAGDMAAAVYDPARKARDVFAYADAGTAQALETARSYADGQASAARTAAEQTARSYTDGKLAGCYIAFTDENGRPASEPYIHWDS